MLFSPETIDINGVTCEEQRDPIQSGTRYFCKAIHLIPSGGVRGR